MTVAIFDLDNCLADDSWRIPLIDWSEEDSLLRYHHYHSASRWDKPHNLHLVNEAHANDRIAILTARPLAHRVMTEVWLRGNGIRYDFLLMRNNYDFSRSCVLKGNQLLWLTGGNYDGVTLADIVAAYDDRPEVIEVYKRMGVPRANVVCIHDVCAYTQPQRRTL